MCEDEKDDMGYSPGVGISIDMSMNMSMRVCVYMIEGYEDM